MIPTKQLTHHVPITPKEIAKDVLKAVKLGATIAHLHARDKDGKPTYKKEIYKEIIGRIKEKNDKILLAVSTSGRLHPTFEHRSEVLELEEPFKPDFGSLTLSSLNFNKQASVNPPDLINGLANKMLDYGIKPELEVFDIGMINYSKYLIKKKLLQPPYYFILILGNIACAQANLLNVGVMINELPENSVYLMGGVGQYQFPMNYLGLQYADGIRIGLEDNIWFNDNRTILASNEYLLKRINKIMVPMNKKPCTINEVREKLYNTHHEHP